MFQNISIVTYHDISDESSPCTAELSLSTRPEVFRNHVAYFSKNFDIVGMDDLFTGRLPRKPLLLTFDDAYRSVLTVAGPILKEISAPSIFFVIPTVVHGNTLPIDNVLSLAVAEIGLTRVQTLMNITDGNATSVGEIISRFIASMRLDEIANVKARIFSVLGTTEQAARRGSSKFLSKTEINELANYGIEIGNHSMTHSHFRALSTRELEVEIRESRNELQRLSGQSVRCLSVPYGNKLDATKDALAVARESGHQAIFLVHARNNRFRSFEDIYYRISLRNEPTWTMPLELHLLPVLRSMYHANPFA